MQHKTTSFPTVPCLIVGAIALGGWAWSNHNRAPQVPVTVIAGLDTSDSVRAPLPGGNTQLGRSRAALVGLGTSLNSNCDTLVLARVDRQTQEFSSAPAPSGGEGFLRFLLDNTQKSAPQRGTFTAAFWEFAAKRAADKERAPGCAIAVALLSDGDNDDLSESAKQQIAASAQALADNPRVVAVQVFGVKPGNFARLNTLFAPLGARFHLWPRQDMAPTDLLERLDAARRKTAQHEAS